MMNTNRAVVLLPLLAVIASGTPFWDRSDFEKAERFARSGAVMAPGPMDRADQWRRWSYIHEFFQTAAFVAGMQVADSLDPEFGGIIEGEDALSVVETDNTQQAIWVWSRFYEMTGDTVYSRNVRRAWLYVMNHPAYDEEGTDSDYYRVWNCGLALFAESKYRAVTGDTSYRWYADTCIEYMMAHPLSFVVGDPYYRRLHPKVTSLAAGMLYQYSKGGGYQAGLDTALTYGDRVRQWIEQDPSVNINDEVWAMSGGTAVWGLCRSVFDADTLAGAAWLGTYLPYMKYQQPSGNWNNSWNIWYANAYNFSGRVTGNPLYLGYHHALTDSMLIQDYDDDGGVPPTRTWNANQDHSWVSNYMVFMGFEGLMDSIKDHDAGISAAGGRGPRAFLVAGDSVRIHAVAANYGWMPLASVAVDISGSFSADTLIGLQTGQEDTVVFAVPWVPGDTGYFSMRAVSFYAGDERPGNDTADCTFFVRPVRTVQGGILDSLSGQGVAADVYVSFIDDTSGAYYDSAQADSVTGAFTVHLIDSLYRAAVGTRIPYPDLKIPYLYVTPDSISGLSWQTSPAGLAIVNRDDLGRYSEFYSYILDSLGLTCKIWVPVRQGLFPVSRIGEFVNDLIIWFSGRSAVNTVTPAEQDSLISFLDAGGRLLITGQNIGEEIGPSAFYRQYLHASLISDSIFALKCFPLVADSLGAQLGKFQTVGSNGANNQYSRDLIAADSIAHEFVFYDSLLTNCAGIWYKDPVAGYKIVYFGFGFEAINKAPWSGYVSRKDVLEEILRWFGTTGIAERGSSRAACGASPFLEVYPNPSRGKMTISIGQRATNTELRIYDVSGRSVRSFTLTPLHSALCWDATDQLGRTVPPGIYFVQLRSGVTIVTDKAVLVKE